ncbi:hypothetical protein QCM8_103 [Bacillus phage QCM8]|nr:hypothetical protein QCM8_103 [Bacillus phage QCM8]
MSMSITGGIDLNKSQKFGVERYKGGHFPHGRFVKYVGKKGYDIDNEKALRYMDINKILRVQEIYVGSWYAEVEFQEFPGVKFNTELFEDINL